MCAKNGDLIEHGNMNHIWLVWKTVESKISHFLASATGQMVIQLITYEMLKEGRFVSRKEQGWYWR